MLDMTEEEEFDLAQRAIKAGITPNQCEQLKLPLVKNLFIDAGFTYHEMKTLFERWDIDSARKKILRGKAKVREKKNANN
jgi:hypothetical protein